MKVKEEYVVQSQFFAATWEDEESFPTLKLAKEFLSDWLTGQHPESRRKFRIIRRTDTLITESKL